jgi:hypothetical protein
VHLNVPHSFSDITQRVPTYIFDEYVERKKDVDVANKDNNFVSFPAVEIAKLTAGAIVYT